MKRLLTFAAATSVALGGCLGGDDRSEDIQRGKRLFAKAGCGDCHTLGEAGATGKVGPSLDAVRPDFSDVQKQVTGGGPGMPAFGDRFSNEEIAAIARYVSDAAGKSLDAVTVRYEPDDTRLSDCHGLEDQPCYQQAFANRTYRAGPGPALALLDRRIQTDRAVATGCHRMAHAMGGAALVRFDDDVGQAFAEGDAVCSSGYYHGILEQSFVDVDDDELADKARGLCKGGPLRIDAFLRFQCVHGLGHGLMLRTRYDLPAVLEVCDEIGEPAYADACEGGAFMENFTTFYEVSSKWLRDDDLLYPCNAVAERHKPACYTIVTAHVLHEVDYDWRETARVCRTAEREWEHVCFRSFGRDAISQNAYDQRRRSTAVPPDRRHGARMCALGSPPHRERGTRRQGGRALLPQHPRPDAAGLLRRGRVHRRAHLRAASLRGLRAADRRPAGELRVRERPEAAGAGSQLAVSAARCGCGRPRRRPASAAARCRAARMARARP